MRVASRALKSLVHCASADRMAASAAPTDCAEAGITAASSRRPHQVSKRVMPSDGLRRLLQDLGDRGLVGLEDGADTVCRTGPVDGEAEGDGHLADDHLARQAEAVEALPVDAATLAVADRIGGQDMDQRIGHRLDALELDQRTGLLEESAGQGL